MDVRVVFMGSPEFAVPSLMALADQYPVVGVVTQPDRPSGRGRKLTAPAVKNSAVALGIPVIQPVSLRKPEALETLHAWKPDLIVVAAFGQILRKNVLQLPRFGCLNVHASLLPRWRGAAPIQAAILHGDKSSGVTIMLMDEGVDTGPILNQAEIPIDEEDTAKSLSEKLASLGASLLVETLPAYLKGDIKPQPQVGEYATKAPMLKKSDGEINPNESVVTQVRKVRAYYPWPGAFYSWNGKRLKIHKARAITSAQSFGKPGERTIYEQQPAVHCKDGLMLLEIVQPPGKKPMPGKAFLAGARDW